MAISSTLVGYNKSCGSYTKPSSYPRSLQWNPISRVSLPNRSDDRIGFSLPGNENYRTKRNSFVVYANTVPGAPTPSGPPSSNPMGWIIGFVVSFVLPFFTSKWGPLWVLKSRIGNAVQTVEDIVEAVEKVAEKVDEIAEDIGEDLPQGKLKDLIHLVENVAEKTAKTADCLDNVIDQVQEAGDQVDNIVESIGKKDKNAPKEALDVKIIVNEEKITKS